METQKRLFDLAYEQLKNSPLKIMFSQKINGKWSGISTQEFVEKVNLASRGLLALGIKPNDKIALISNNRTEWNIMDFGIQQIGAVGVPIYPNISIKDYRYIFNDAEIKLCVTSNDELYQKIQSIKSELPQLKLLFTFDEIEGIPNWNEILKTAEKVDISEVNKIKDTILNKDLATIIYTSGTTGNPKGVMLSHNNILSNVYGCMPRIPTATNGRALSFLPISHVYERMLHYLYMASNFSIYFAESLDTIGENLKEVKPHIFVAVPRVLEKIYERIITIGDGLKGFKKMVFFWALSVGNKFELEGKSFFYKLKLKLAGKLVFSKWKEAVGGEVLAVASGAAALQPRLARIFFAAGIPVIEGYGLTETSPVISVNWLGNGVKFGTVGPILDNVEVKIAEDGEIIVRGDSVMMGYYKQPEKTKEVLDDDGWFHTGDIGEFIDGRFLKITDRKKEIFKTSGGKFITPQIMENKFKESRFIQQIMVIGEGYKHPAALIVPAYDFVREWALRKNIEVSERDEKLIENSQVVARIQEEIDKYNELFGHYEQIKKFELLPEEFSIEKGEITPTLKFKRKNILQSYKHLVDKIYG